jgi:hypothetical protein
VTDLIHVTGKKRRQRLMLVSVALLIATILVVGVNLVAPIAFAQDWDDWDSGSTSGCCCCCAGAMLPLACLGLTYSWRADAKDDEQ